MREEGHARISAHGPKRKGLETPVLLLIFNRPSTTRQVMERVRAARPTGLYVAADGARREVAGERTRCEQARAVATTADWPCHVQGRFQDENMGLALHVRSALDWFFEHEEEGIILEDDCVPDPSFFPFCAEMLSFYRTTPQVMHISGNNFQYGRWRGSGSYYFSKYPLVWGWATWRRAWSRYDFEAAPTEVRRGSWATSWRLTLERCGGAAVVPNVNLVTNIGFGPDATHTRTLERFAHLPARSMHFPLVHPADLTIDHSADTLTYYANFRNVRFLRLIWLYRAWDVVLARLKALKRGLVGFGSAPRIY